MFDEIRPTEPMLKEAEKLQEGEILICYLDEGSIRIETESGQDPYVWRNGTWRRMCSRLLV